MSHMLRRAVDRLPEKSVRTDSQGVRSDSRPLRIDVKVEFLAAVNETRTALGLSVEAMAINAGCTTSAMSDALAGKDSRNFAGQWLLAQGDAFIAKFNETIERQRGLTQDAEDALEAERIGALVQQLVTRSFRARRLA